MMIDLIEDGPIRTLARQGDADDWLSARTSVFEITNVAHLAARTSWLKQDQVDLTKFPNVAPPFRSYWMEWDDQLRDYDRIGCWCVVTADTDSEDWHISIGIWTGSRKPRPLGAVALRCPRDGTPPTEDRVLSLFDGASVRGRRRCESSESGAETQRLEQKLSRIKHLPREQQEQEMKRWMAEAEAQAAEATERIRELDTKLARIVVLPPLLLAHSLLSCRNVSTEEHRHPEAVRRAFRRRHGGRDRVVYKTLTITPAGGTKGSEERISLGAGQSALHLVRGHFKTFTPDRPLFGSSVGTWWWSPSVRGTAEAGTVAKDYRIVADALVSDTTDAL